MPKKPISPAPAPSTSGPTVTVSLALPVPLYMWIAYTAHQKGRTVGSHIAAWISRSLEPWDEAIPLPRDADDGQVVHVETSAKGEAYADLPKRPTPQWRQARAQELQLHPEDFPDLEAYKKAERRQRAQKARETLKRKRALKPRVIAPS